MSDRVSECRNCGEPIRKGFFLDPRWRHVATDSIWCVLLDPAINGKAEPVRHAPKKRELTK